MALREREREREIERERQWYEQFKKYYFKQKSSLT